MPEPQRVLILTSDTGAGRRSVADALIIEAQARPESELELVAIDPLAPLPPAFWPAGGDGGDRPAGFDRLVRLSGRLIARSPSLSGLLFQATNNAAGLAAYRLVAGRRALERIKAAAEATQASAIVSVHPLLSHAMVRARERLGRAMPLLAVVTDLINVHRWWVSDGVDQYVAGSPSAAEQLRAAGVAPSRVAELGVPVRRPFARHTATVREAKLRLGFDPEQPLILVLGGAGAGRPAATARAIGDLATERTVPAFQLAVLTAGDHQAELELQRRTWPLPVHVRGVVPNIAEYMAAADVIATKPGSVAIAEALCLGRPLLLGRPLPGQETGNVPFVVGHGAGLAYRSPAEAAAAAAYLLSDPSARWEMGQAAARISHPRATERTLDLLQALLLRARSR